jgi:rhamnosyltransferase
MPRILHPEFISRLPLTGKRIHAQLLDGMQRLSDTSESIQDPAVSVVIRTKNDIHQLPSLFADIAAQEYLGHIEIILVDTESNDGTTEFARSQGAKVIPISQTNFTYPRALNLGFAAASHDYVVTVVGHSNLSNTMQFKCLSKWHQVVNFGGLFALPVPGALASASELLIAAYWMRNKFGEAKEMHQSEPGMLAANASIVNRKLWQKLGGYDEAYAGGGEDTALARSMLAVGAKILYEPVFIVHHSHGVGPINALRQAAHWRQVGLPFPRPFDESSILARRPDLRKKRH